MGKRFELKKAIAQENIQFGWTELLRAYNQLLGTYRTQWIIFTITLFTVHFYQIVPPFILGKIVDFFTQYQRNVSLAPFYSYIIILGVSYAAISLFRLWVKNRLGDIRSEIKYQIKVRAFQQLLDMSLKWHSTENAGIKAQRVATGVSSFAQLNKRIDSTILPTIASVIGSMVVFALLRPHFVIFFGIYIVGVIIIMLFNYKRVVLENNRYYGSIEAASGSYVEGLGNILTIKAHGAQEGFQEYISQRESQSRDHEKRIRSLFIDFWQLFQVFNGVSYMAFLVLVGRDVVSGVITPGSMIIFFGYLESLKSNMGDIMDTYEIVIDAKAGIARMMEIFWSKPVVTHGARTAPTHWESITIQRGTFIYNTSGDQNGKVTHFASGIADISISFLRGEKIGIVGETGSGKSTFVKVLAGLHPLQSGSYTIGGVSFYDLTHEEQTKLISFVLQESEIFQLSLKDNITLFAPEEKNRLTQALSIAQLNEVIERLPQGLHTIVGEKGYTLSGGERQRVGIARAIYRNAPILIMDEATSALDSRTEQLIQEGIERNLEDKTVISIAHRISTLANTDMIYVFDRGQIVESGHFKRLITNTESLFFTLSHSPSDSKDE